jgi:hypothetical protein
MFRNIFIALAAVALLALGASAVIPTSAVAYYDEYRDYCNHRPYDPYCWPFYHHRYAEENEQNHDYDHDQDQDQDHEHQDQDHEHHDQDHEHHDQDHDHDHDHNIIQDLIPNHDHDHDHDE